MHQRILPLFFCLLFLLFAVSMSDEDALKALGLCAEIERYVNALVEYTDTKCLPSQGEQKDTFAFIVLAEQPIFSVAASKKEWLMVVVGAIGKVLGNNKKYNVSEVYVGDVHLVKNRKAFWLPGSVTKGPLKNVQDGHISLDEFYVHIQKEMKEKNIPKSEQSGT